MQNIQVWMKKAKYTPCATFSELLKIRHSREGGNPDFCPPNPVCTSMTWKVAHRVNISVTKTGHSRACHVLRKG
jgi:hypothetical protein